MHYILFNRYHLVRLPSRRFWRWLHFRRTASSPYVVLDVSSLAAIALGTQALRLPAAVKGDPLSWTDAAFTATSAICVTGLTVKSTGQDFTFLGQLLILAMIQFGGIVIVTLSSLFFLQIRGKSTLFDHSYTQDYLGAAATDDPRHLLWRVVAYIATIEGVGAGLLFLRFAFEKDVEVSWLRHVLHAL